MNYFSLIDEIKQVSLRYSEEFYEGDIYEYLNSGNHKYPCIILTVQNITTDDDVNTISATIFAVDRLTNDSSNKLEVQSLCMSKITQILGTLEEKVSNIQSNTLTPFTEKFSDLCGGMYGEFTLEYIGDNLCVDEIEIKEIKLTQNGIYDVIGYDRAFVNVVAVGVDDAYTWIENRVKGSEDGTIPAIPLKEPLNGENLVENLSVLDNRRITNGDDTPDGVSLARIICDSSIQIQNLIDDNVGWVMNIKGALSNITTNFIPNLQNVVLNCIETTETLWDLDANESIKTIKFPKLERCVTKPLIALGWNGKEKLYFESIEFSELKEMGCLFAYGGNGWWVGELPNLHTLSFPKLNIITREGGGRGAFIEIPCTSIEVLSFPNLTAMYRSFYGGNCLPNIREIRMPLLKIMQYGLTNSTASIPVLENLQLLEVGSMETNMDVRFWNPTNKGEVFLSNFQTYIADRVSDRTGKSALTLTLSAGVYEALEAQEGQTILATLTNKNWTVVQA